VRFYGGTVVIGMHRPLPIDKQINGGIYDYKSGTEIYLKPKAAKTLARFLTVADSERIKGNEITSHGISSGANMIEIGSGKKYGCKDDSVCIAVYKDIDNTTKKPSSYDVFEFNDDVVLRDYDPEAGTYSSELLNVDIDFLVDQLKDYAKSAGNGAVHNHRVVDKYEIDRFRSNQLEMMNKLGIENKTATTRTDWNSPSGDSGTGSAVYSDSSEELMKEISGL